MNKRTLVVGAGLSGLCCARTLQHAGEEALILEASDGVGGRVRTDIVEGFRLDRGFQVLFTAYPAIRAEIDLERLDLCAFDPGAVLYHQNRRYPLYDAFRVPSQMIATMLSPLLGSSDKLLIAHLRRNLMGMTLEQIFALPDVSLETYLRQLGFSPDFLDRFVRPFYGGIFLDRSLSTSARMFAFVFKMLSEGGTAVPAMGMGALCEQIAADLAPESVRLNSPVESLLRDGKTVCGVRLQDGTELLGSSVVLAVEASAAARLSGIEIPLESRASACLYFEVPEAFYSEKLLLLFTDPQSLVNNAALLTNVAPSYAPQGKHLLSVTALGDPPFSDEELVERVRQEMATKLPQARTSEWRHIKTYRIRWAQYAQPSGVWDSLPKTESGIPGLFFAGEMTHSSSLHGALFSGRSAAEAILATPRPPKTPTPAL